MSVFVGPLLRLFTRSSKLIDALIRIEVIKQLVQLITNPAFDISSDSYETFHELLLSRERDYEIDI